MKWKSSNKENGGEEMGVLQIFERYENKQIKSFCLNSDFQKVKIVK